MYFTLFDASQYKKQEVYDDGNTCCWISNTIKNNPTVGSSEQIVIGKKLPTSLPMHLKNSGLLAERSSVSTDPRLPMSKLETIIFSSDSECWQLLR